jgi:hypothetical protein
MKRRDSRRRCRRTWLAPGLVILLLGGGGSAPVGALTILTRDTRIDARHSIRDDVLVRSGDRGYSPTVTLVAGGTIAGHLFADARSTIRLCGGAIGGHLIARERSTVTLSSGTVAVSLFANHQSTVVVSGGSISLELRALDDSTVTIMGGAIGADVQAFPGSRITIAGGRMGADLYAFGECALTVTGGSLAGYLYADRRATLRCPDGALRPLDPAPVIIGGSRCTRYRVSVSPPRPLPLRVNGRNFEIAGLMDGEIRELNIAAAMQPGDNNTIEITAKGKPGGSAHVLIWGP